MKPSNKRVGVERNRSGENQTNHTPHPTQGHHDGPRIPKHIRAVDARRQHKPHLKP